MFKDHFTNTLSCLEQLHHPISEGCESYKKVIFTFWFIALKWVKQLTPRYTHCHVHWFYSSKNVHNNHKSLQSYTDANFNSQQNVIEIWLWSGANCCRQNDRVVKLWPIRRPPSHTLIHCLHWNCSYLAASAQFWLHWIFSKSTYLYLTTYELHNL